MKSVREWKRPIRNENLWRNYVRCNPIPDTQTPAVVRTFLYRFLYEYDDYQSNFLNWWVKCDEKSLLTQDIDVPDTTRMYVKPLREPTGKFYDRKLRFMMKVYESLEETLRRRKVSAERLSELTTVVLFHLSHVSYSTSSLSFTQIRDEMRETAFKFLDALTIEVIMHIDREMESMTPLIAHYTHASADFVKFIWSFKDVTLPVYR